MGPVAKMDEDNAAAKMQSATRAKNARELTQKKREFAAQKAAELEIQRQQKASATLSAGAKGYSHRRAAKLQQEELSKSSVRIQANFRGKKERADPAAEANVRRERSKNDPQMQASAYLKEHKIMVCFCKSQSTVLNTFVCLILP